MSYITVDSSTSSTTVLVFDEKLEILKKFQKDHSQIVTQEGYIEHDLEEIYQNLLDDLKPQKNSYSSLIEFVEDRPGHDFRYAIDATKIEKELGWKPEENFETGIKKTVSWFLENQNWWEKIQKLKYKQERLGVL